MTVSLKVHVNGNYRATVTHTVVGKDGTEHKQPTTVVEPQEEKQVYFQHGSVNLFSVTEEYLGEKQG